MNRAPIVSRPALILAFATGMMATVAGAQTNSARRDCPIGVVDTTRWLTTRDTVLGLEISHPLDYREQHWENRSDTSSAALSFWRNAASAIDFNGFESRTKNVVPACRLQTRSGVLELRVDRIISKLWSRRDTIDFIGRAVLTPPGKATIRLQTTARDSVSLLEQLAILRTIRFLPEQ